MKEKSLYSRKKATSTACFKVPMLFESVSIVCCASTGYTVTIIAMSMYEFEDVCYSNLNHLVVQLSSFLL